MLLCHTKKDILNRFQTKTVVMFNVTYPPQTLSASLRQKGLIVNYNFVFYYFPVVYQHFDLCDKTAEAAVFCENCGKFKLWCER